MESTTIDIVVYNAIDIHIPQQTTTHTHTHYDSITLPQRAIFQSGRINLPPLFPVPEFQKTSIDALVVFGFLFFELLFFELFFFELLFFLFFSALAVFSFPSVFVQYERQQHRTERVFGVNN